MEITREEADKWEEAQGIKLNDDDINKLNDLFKRWKQNMIEFQEIKKERDNLTKEQHVVFRSMILS